MQKQFKTYRPPRIAEWILRHVTEKVIRYSALGDFEEHFNDMAIEEGIFKANVWYWLQTVRSIPGFIAGSIYWSVSMLKNYFVVALRYLKKHKTYSFINIFGLSVGIACAALIFLFVRNEYSYDSFHQKSDRIFRLWRNLHHPIRGDRPGLFIPYVLGEHLKESYPEVEAIVRIASLNSSVRQDDDVFNETLLMASPELFEVFSFPILKGSKTRPLPDRNSIVITEEMALKYFGTPDPVGRRLLVQFFEGEETLQVSAVAKNPPENSSIDFDFVVHVEKAREFLADHFFDSWRAAFAESFVELSTNTTIEAFQEKLASLEDRYNEGLGQDFRARVYVQRLTDIHLSSDVRDEVIITSNPKYSYILTGLGLLILFIACVNFTTLALGRIMDRAREAGMRKVMGALSSQLIKQYLGEVLLTCFISIVIAALLAQVLLPLFNELSGKSLAFSLDIPTILLVLFITFVIGGAAGLYPAFVLSRFQPGVIFKQSFSTGRRNIWGRGLVVFQFSISIFLVTAALMMREQLDYIRAKNLGYDSERVIEIDMSSTPSDAAQLFERYKNELLKDRPSLKVAAAMSSFDSQWPTMGYNDEFDHLHKFFFNQVTYDYLPTMGMEIVEGRNFSREFGTDHEQAIIVNEAFIKQLGWQSGLNQALPDKFNSDMKIVGVLKDFHFTSMHDEIQPLVLTLNRSPLAQMDYGRGVGQIAVSTMVVRIGKGELQPIINFLREKWQRVAPNKPFDWTFLDETIARQYSQEQRWGSIMRYSAILAIVIACLGLFGLAALAIQKRVKEIGIRKVLGASVPQIVSLVSKDLLLLILLSNLLAWPMAYFTLQRWLQDFAYRVDINLFTFMLSSLFTLFIAVMTISHQAIKAALANPIDSLHVE